jgi:hypothetical protein
MYYLDTFIYVEKSSIRLRTVLLKLSKREREHADRIARNLWPGLVPIPKVMHIKVNYGYDRQYFHVRIDAKYKR